VTYAVPVDLSETVPLVLVQPSTPRPEDPGGKPEDFGKSSPVGFLVLILFFIAVAFLIRSMNKHLKRVPASFDKPEAEPAGEPDKAERADKAESNGKSDSA
jgi:hypothetical protein